MKIIHNLICFSKNMGIFFIFFINCMEANSQVLLRYKYIDKSEYKVESEAYNELTTTYLGKQYSSTGVAKNQIFFKVEKQNDGKGKLFINYKVIKIHDGVGNEMLPNKIVEEDNGIYLVDQLGYENILKDSKLKNIKDVGVLPEEPVKVGDKWKNIGENCFKEIDKFEIKIPISIENEYIGKQKYEEDDALPEYKNTLFDVVRTGYDYSQTFLKNESSVKLINGKVRMLNYIDSELGRERYRIYVAYLTFEYQNGRVDKYVINYHSRTFDTKKIEDKEQLAENIKKELKSEGYDADVLKKDDGLSINMIINFNKNLSNIREDEIAKLNAIGKILNKFKGRNVLVKGHTSEFNESSESDHQKLSEDRAENVAEYLAKNGFVDLKNIIVKGAAFREPLYPNNSEENRQKNRRVEIIILDN